MFATLPGPNALQTCCRISKCWTRWPTPAEAGGDRASTLSHPRCRRSTRVAVSPHVRCCAQSLDETKIPAGSDPGDYRRRSGLAPATGKSTHGVPFRVRGGATVVDRQRRTQACGNLRHFAYRSASGLRVFLLHGSNSTGQFWILNKAAKSSPLVHPDGRQQWVTCAPTPPMAADASQGNRLRVVFQFRHFRGDGTVRLRVRPEGTIRDSPRGQRKIEDDLELAADKASS